MDFLIHWPPGPVVATVQCQGLACMRTLRRHVHHQAGANCTDAKLYFWKNFQFFFYPNGTWTHPPTSKLFLDFLNLFNFAKPLSCIPYLNVSHHTVEKVVKG